jgi:hypothetical protein
MPQLDTVMDWLAKHEEFARQMIEARELRADKHRDKIEELIEQVAAGKIDPQSGRVSIEGLKWLAGIEKPQKYGERIRVEHIISKGPDADSESERSPPSGWTGDSHSPAIEHAGYTTKSLTRQPAARGGS